MMFTDLSAVQSKKNKMDSFKTIYRTIIWKHVKGLNNKSTLHQHFLQYVFLSYPDSLVFTGKPIISVYNHPSRMVSAGNCINCVLCLNFINSVEKVWHVRVVSQGIVNATTLLAKGNELNFYFYLYVSFPFMTKRAPSQEIYSLFWFSNLHASSRGPLPMSVCGYIGMTSNWRYR